MASGSPRPSFGNLGFRGGQLCNSEASCQAEVHAAAHGSCPATLGETWAELDGFEPDVSLAMRCTEDGGWLAPGVQAHREPYFGIRRSTAFGITRQFCRSASEWSHSRHWSHGPPIFGSDVDIQSAYRNNRSLHVLVLRLSMGRPWNLAVPDNPPPNLQTLYTPCRNLAFTLCAARGWLPSQGGPNIYLASSGQRLGQTCHACAGCREDLAWDECWITKQEFCTLQRACRNGDEIWQRGPGMWRCDTNVEEIEIAAGRAPSHALQKVHRAFATGGVIMRLWECSLPECMQTDGFKAENGGSAIASCAWREARRRNQPASLLRWDLPAAIFNGGRCTQPSQAEQGKSQTGSADPNVMDKNGFRVNGYTGHNVSASGIGWLFIADEISIKSRGGAFPHDAWTTNFRKSHVHAGADIPECGLRAQTRSQYARSRLALLNGGQQRRDSALAAAAYKWSWVNTSWNCYNGRTRWNETFAKQRAYASLLAERKASLVEAGLQECSIWGSLYNQVHLSWNLSMVKALFYVNDTLTPSLAPDAPLLLTQADTVASRALRAARRIQTALNKIYGISIPIVQYRFSRECYDAWPSIKRIQAVHNANTAKENSMGSVQSAAAAIFADPPTLL